MASQLPSLIFGSLLVLGAIVMLAVQRRASRRLQQEQPEKAEERFQKRRILRRTQVAGMILVIGIMIIIGDSVIGENWKNAKGTFAVYWLVVLALAIWTGLLAIGDIAATRAHLMAELNQLHRRNLDLQGLSQQIKEAERKRASGNGYGSG